MEIHATEYVHIGNKLILRSALEWEKTYKENAKEVEAKYHKIMQLRGQEIITCPHCGNYLY